ncbi:hypothetical protein BpHYR1_023027 [Brachionus plicatilis]|uniref:Uncharacterized protein n=1 Tax=Brachionus plicatilis TaxID=10195 RepID=A0A3M7T7Q3_BRAPC|nr:hypothetical protein BpHYR1_023027 [Brachionus plicatilis]
MSLKYENLTKLKNFALTVEIELICRELIIYDSLIKEAKCELRKVNRSDRFRRNSFLYAKLNLAKNNKQTDFESKKSSFFSNEIRY